MDSYVKAEAAGILIASKDISVMYEQGIGREPDLKKAAVYYQKAEDAGEPPTMYYQGLLYADGRGVTKK